MISPLRKKRREKIKDRREEYKEQKRVAKRPLNRVSGCGFAVTRQKRTDEQVSNDNNEVMCVFVHGEIVRLAIITSHSLMTSQCLQVVHTHGRPQDERSPARFRD